MLKNAVTSPRFKAPENERHSSQHSDLRLVFGDDTQMSTKIILRKLAEIEEAPWGDIKGKPLDERGIARRLKEYEIRSKNLKLDAGAVAKGYTRADLFDGGQGISPRHPTTALPPLPPLLKSRR